MRAHLYDDRRCLLGEGPLWHPERQELFWVDIFGHKILSRAGETASDWRFDAMPSALGWIDADHLLVATQHALIQLSLSTGAQEPVVSLEPNLPQNRSNDGRADPYGGFWIGTLKISEDAPEGSFYRYYKGELRKLFGGIYVSNAACFSPDGLWAYFADTKTQIVQRVRLSEKDGWPVGDPEPWLDLTQDGLHPDGAVTAADGTFWIAKWGVGRVAQYDLDGRLLRTIDIPAANSTCPAFGGPDLTTLFCTSAAKSDRAPLPDAGCVFFLENMGPGQAEHRVIL
ncbi:MAG: SMP-30/gluconolactonase/LRE family protein [Pseudomonadota bacterium]